MLQVIYVNEYDEKYKNISKESIQEILNMLLGEDYNYGLFTYVMYRRRLFFLFFTNRYKLILYI